MRSKGLNRSTRRDKCSHLDSSHISAKHFLAGSEDSTQMMKSVSQLQSQPRINTGWRNGVWEAGKQRDCAMLCDIVVGSQMYNQFDSSKSCRHLSKQHLPHGASSYLADGWFQSCQIYLFISRKAATKVIPY